MPIADADFVENYLSESVEARAAFQLDTAYRRTMIAMADGIVSALRAGGKLPVAGNAQPIAGARVERAMFPRGAT